MDTLVLTLAKKVVAKAAQEVGEVYVLSCCVWITKYELNRGVPLATPNLTPDKKPSRQSDKK